MKTFGSILVLLSCFSLNFAHSCSSYSLITDIEYSKKLQEINSIFYGEIISISEPMNCQDEFKYGTQNLKVKVLESWKGVQTNEVTVLYTRAYTTFEKEIGNVGTKKVFYAYKRDDDSNLHVDFCSFSSFDDKKMKREFGEGKTFEEPKKEIQTGGNSENFLSIIRQKIISFFS